MSEDALSLLSGGMFPSPTGIPIASRGLLLEAIDGGEAPDGPFSIDGSRITDIAIRYRQETRGFDMGVASGHIVIDQGLLTAVLLSVFTDRLAEPDDRLPDEDDAPHRSERGGADRRGWWADVYNRVTGDREGSRLWLLFREKKTQETRLRAIEYVREALDWMVEDEVAGEIRVTAEWLDGLVLGVSHAAGFLGVQCEIVRPQGLTARITFAVAWEGL